MHNRMKTSSLLLLLSLKQVNLGLIDSGCTNHMTYDRELFMRLSDTEVKWVKIGNDEQIPIKGKGSIAITSYTGKKNPF